MTAKIQEMPAATPAPVSLKEFDVSSLFVADKATRDASAATLAALAQEKGPAALTGRLRRNSQGSRRQKVSCCREGAADTILTLSKNSVKALEPSFIGSGIYAALLEAFADKMPAVRTAAVEAKAARDSLTKATALVSNKDIERFIPALIKALINPVEEVPGTIMLLSATTFVSEVDSPTLSLMVPLLSRGLSEKLTSTKRKVAVLLTHLLPSFLVSSRSRPPSETPRARGVIGKAIRYPPSGRRGRRGWRPRPFPGCHLQEARWRDLHRRHHDHLYLVARRCPRHMKNFEVPEWDKLAPYLAYVASTPDPISVTHEWVVRSAVEGDDEEVVNEDEEEGEDLCNCQFSLAYGAKILLNTAVLRLKRGHRYGLQVEGFPSPDEVRTFYVEHDIDGSEEDTTVLEFILADKRILATKEEVIETLASMKLALARAMLFRADILLLDEPTNHLDVVNVAWLENYLTGLKTCTSIIVSHDSGFLNNTITDVLHLNRFKLRRYRGNLEKFVQQVPEAKSYYTLEAAEDYRFKLPDPPLLEGVKTKEKSLLKMRKVGFQYPTSQVQQLHDITLQVSLSSRVAVLGPNGSGKSTLGGEIWKHPNLVIGYVAQHAFHHIDNHLDKTPLEYMLWRYQTGEDLEEMQKANRIISEEEMQKMKDGAVVVIEGQKRLIDEILARKKLKQSYEYEVSFKGLSSSENIWLPRDDLVKRGFEKKVIEVDTREAQRLGLLRPLVRREIEKHMADFGLEPEFVSHNTMRGLSGGQKVKIVLGAATWRRPHIMCLDEPTNYLDRESLAALIEALKAFEGGVLVITHNRDFSESICKEVWAMRDGRLEASGHNWVEGQGSGPRIDKADGEEEDQYDAMGNKIDTKKLKKISAGEARKLKKERMARKKRGEEVTDDEL
ncbi:hypothetical protein B0H12DRAFT_1116885 [Mycena haematopus]|nr:hypothetical protein B0H12DRAFT_1116885 [Mycena haematopus]